MDISYLKEIRKHTGRPLIDFNLGVRVLPLFGSPSSILEISLRIHIEYDRLFAVFTRHLPAVCFLV